MKPKILRTLSAAETASAWRKYLANCMPVVQHDRPLAAGESLKTIACPKCNNGKVRSIMFEHKQGKMVGTEVESTCLYCEGTLFIHGVHPDYNGQHLDNYIMVEFCAGK